MSILLVYSIDFETFFSMNLDDVFFNHFIAYGGRI